MSETSPQGYMEIHHAFSESEFGQKLADQVRYERYKPQSVTNEQWVKLLGADVNNLTHLPLTYGLTRAMVRRLHTSSPGLLSAEEEGLLYVAALTHDWGEALSGDITYSNKTNLDEATEREHLAGIIKTFSGSTTNMGTSIENVIRDIVFNSESKLGYLFNTVERVGYMRTALRATHHISANTSPVCNEGLQWLVADVLGNHTAVLISRAEESEPVKDYLTATATQIEQAFQLVDPHIFLRYEPEKRLEKIQMFYEGELQFSSWSSGHSPASVEPN